MKKLSFRGHYNPRKILATGATYIMAYGERSNGKTYGFLGIAFEEFEKSGRPSAYIRRRAESIKTSSMKNFLKSHEANGHIPCGDFAKYRGGSWYSGINSEGKAIYMDTPFLDCYAISQDENAKGTTSNCNYKYIIFDEFLTRHVYLNNEFVRFMNLLSTLIRENDDVTIILLGNTVNFSSIYFNEMGLTNVRNQKQGTIEIYECLNDLDEYTKISVEYCANAQNTKKRATNKYFCFDSPEIKMITEGVWETALYPHVTWNSRKDKLLYREVYIIYDEYIINIEYRQNPDFGFYVFCHEHTTDIDDRAMVIFSDTLVNEQRYYYDFKNTKNGKIILDAIRRKRIYYSNNFVGEVVRNYLQNIAMRV